jgi:hypothetical protein
VAMHIVRDEAEIEERTARFKKAMIPWIEDFDGKWEAQKKELLDIYGKLKSLDLEKVRPESIAFGCPYAGNTLGERKKRCKARVRERETGFCCRLAPRNTSGGGGGNRLIHAAGAIGLDFRLILETERMEIRVEIQILDWIRRGRP